MPTDPGPLMLSVSGRPLRGRSSAPATRTSVNDLPNDLVCMQPHTIKAVLLAITMACFGTLWLAVFANRVATLLVVGDGQRLLHATA